MYLYKTLYIKYNRRISLKCVLIVYYIYFTMFIITKTEISAIPGSRLNNYFKFSPTNKHLYATFTILKKYVDLTIL